MASSDSQIDKPEGGRPKRAELPDVNINKGAQSINTERGSLILKVIRSYKLLKQEKTTTRIEKIKKEKMWQ